MLMCMDQGGTGHAGERLGEADHPGPMEDFDSLMVESCHALFRGDHDAAQAIVRKMWKIAQGWSRASVSANGGVNNRVSFLRSRFFQDTYAANKHMRDVEWWPAWREEMLTNMLDSGVSATEVHVPLSCNIHFFIIRMLKNIVRLH